MRKIGLAATVALLVLGLPLAVAHVLLSRDPPPVRHPKVTAGTRVDELVALLVAAKGNADEQVKLVRAFADTRRPAAGSKEFASADGKFFVVVAANGTRSHPDGFDAAGSDTYPAGAEVIPVRRRHPYEIRSASRDRTAKATRPAMPAPQAAARATTTTPSPPPTIASSTRPRSPVATNWPHCGRSSKPSSDPFDRSSGGSPNGCCGS